MRLTYRGRNTTVNTMCGIFGSFNFTTFETLYRKNCTRGTFAGGSIYVEQRTGDMYAKKWSGTQTEQELTGEYSLVHPGMIFAGHTQAPTSANRDYDVDTTHPFEHGRWIVAHNGVLENDRELRDEYLKNATGEYNGATFNALPCTVDSAVIPALLDELYMYSDVDVLSDVLNLLKGTFAVWAYNKQTKQMYIARSGSTLFADISESVFSSVLIDGVADQEIHPGTIYCMTVEGMAQVGSFEYDNPFFML